MNVKHCEKIGEAQLANGAKGFIDAFIYPRPQSKPVASANVVPRPALTEAFGLQELVADLDTGSVGRIVCDGPKGRITDRSSSRPGNFLARTRP